MIFTVSKTFGWITINHFPLRMNCNNLQFYQSHLAPSSDQNFCSANMVNVILAKHGHVSQHADICI